jgi:hypothetical protein
MALQRVPSSDLDHRRGQHPSRPASPWGAGWLFASRSPFALGRHLGARPERVVEQPGDRWRGEDRHFSAGRLTGGCMSRNAICGKVKALDPRPGGPAGAMASTTRRLAAVLAADVAGYSRLMGANEVGTARALREFAAPPIPLSPSMAGAS